MYKFYHYLVCKREEDLRLPRDHQKVCEEGGGALDGAGLRQGEGGARALQCLLEGDGGRLEDADVLLDHGRMYAGLDGIESYSLFVLQKVSSKPQEWSEEDWD